MANLKRNHNSAATVVTQLLSAQWVDVRTRAVCLELLAYNPTTSLYTEGYVSFEFFAGGGLLTGQEFYSLQFDRYSGSNKLSLIALQLVFVVVILVLSLSALRDLCKQHLRFFTVCRVHYLYFSYVY